jgi:SAM-dependent methyltransferase
MFDLIAANNVLAQVPDLNSFVAGIRTLLAPAGVVTIEFPHLMRLVEENQFDTIYHEHFSYFSFLTTVAILAAHDLEVFDVEELWTHGGSLRVLAAPAGQPLPSRTAAGDELLERERTLLRPLTARGGALPPTSRPRGGTPIAGRSTATFRT